MKVAVDFDGTLADTNALIVSLMNFKFGTHYKPSEIDDWKFWANLGPEYDEAFWAIYDLMDSSHLRRTIPPTDPLACAAVKYLVKRGHDVSLLTSNVHHAQSGMSAWLFGHGLGEVPVVTLGRKTASDKVDCDFELYLDDAPSMPPAIVKYNDEHVNHVKRLILPTQPWNVKTPIVSPFVRRLDRWVDVFPIFAEWGL